MKNIPSTKLGRLESTYKPGIKLGKIDECLPDFITKALRVGIAELDRKIKTDLSINVDVKSFITKLNTKALNTNIETWQKKVLSYKEKYSSLYTIDKKEKMPNKIISLI